jgi:hypothetical protein
MVEGHRSAAWTIIPRVSQHGAAWVNQGLVLSRVLGGGMAGGSRKRALWACNSTRARQAIMGGNEEQMRR